MRRLRTWLVLVSAFALGALAVPAMGQEAMGSITGVVTDAATGEPLGSQQLVLSGDFEFGSRVAMTKNDGTYRFGDLPPGTTYKLEAGNDWMASPSDYMRVWWPDAQFFEDSGDITVLPGQVTAGIDFALVVGGVVRGTITDAWTGEPIPYASACPEELHGGRWLGSVCISSDENGFFEVTGFGDEIEYRLTFSANDYQFSETDEMMIPAGEVVTLDTQMTPTYGTPFAMIGGRVCETVEGRCLAGDGGSGSDLVAGVAVEARTPRGELLGSTLTDEWGGFYFEGLTPGEIVVSAAAPGGTTVSDPQTYTVGPNEGVWDVELELTKIGTFLTLHSWVGPDAIEAGDEVDLHVDVFFRSLAEPIDAFEVTNVIVAIHLPEGVEYVAHSSDGPYDEGTDLWTIPGLPYLGRAGLTLTLRLPDEGTFRPHAEIVGSDWPDSRSVFGDGRGLDYSETTLEVLAPAPVPVDDAVIEGQVGADSDGDGVLGPEEGLEDVVVVVTAGETEVSASTDADGSYRVEGLAADTYLVAVDVESLPEGMTLETDAIEVSVSQGESVGDVDFIVVESTNPLLWVVIFATAALVAVAGGMIYRVTSRRPDEESGAVPEAEVPVATEPEKVEA